jgi:hypothetical protein
MAFKEVKTYLYEISTRDDYPAKLDLFDKNKKIIARVLFAGDSRPLPENRGHPGYYSIYFRFSALPPIIDMLRNEKPVYFDWEEKEKRGHIKTSKEPVGEEESTHPIP